MTRLTTSDTLETIRGLLPDLTAVLEFAQPLPGPIDPVIDAYLRDHVGLWRMRCAGQTDTGPIRSHNEDGFFVCPHDRAFAVFDGMGGSASGRPATEAAIAQFANRFPRNLALTTDRPPLTAANSPLVAAIEDCNRAIAGMVEQNRAHQGMGCTAAGLFFEGDTASVAHVGDSRVYRFRNGVLTQMTEDHSLLNEYRRLHDMTDEEEEAFPYKNVITRALGMKGAVEVAHATHIAGSGELYLLCTDGLSDTLSDGLMEDILVESRGQTPTQICARLIQEAIDAKANDNVAVVIVELG